MGSRVWAAAASSFPGVSPAASPLATGGSEVHSDAAASVSGAGSGDGSQVVCAADACYTRENMDRDVLPNILWDSSIMRQSLGRLRQLRDRAGATMFYGHDPAQWATMPRVPTPVV